MIDGLRPYPETKATGLPWLPAIPEHWRLHRAKRSFREIDDRSEGGAEELLSVSHKTGVTPRNQKNVTMFMAETYEGHKLCRPGDIVVNTMWAWMAAVGVSRQVGIVSPSYGVYRARSPESFVPLFLDYLLRTETYKAEYVRGSRGITTSRLRLYPEDFLTIPLIQPPVEEQRLIVRFLDAHGALTTRLIRAKQRLIKLLEEQKQGIIHRAVTRGLDPGVRLKRSGIPWLGDVPEHWEIVALRHRYRQCLGKMLDEKRIRGDHLVCYLRNVDVQWDRINFDNIPTMDIQPAEYERYLVRKGDLLVCEGGEVGRAAIWDAPIEICGFQKALHRLRPVSPKCDDPRFMMFALRSAGSSGAFADGHESTISHLTGEKLRQHRFAFPGLEEQDEIVAHIDAALAELRRAVAAVEEEIALLREFRARLIAEVVTGKLDVRAKAATLPEITESEPIDEPSDGEDLEEPIDDVEDEVVAA